MCGIFGYICSRPNDMGLTHSPLPTLVNMGGENYSRGPDGCIVREIRTDEYYICAQFHRLSIVGVQNGDQPFVSKDGSIWVMVNGEIYNYQSLIINHQLEVETKSDCEVVLKLYDKYGIEKTINLLDGVWAIVIFNTIDGEVHFARDMWGVRPLHYATGLKMFSKEHSAIADLAVSSTAKSLKNENYDWVLPRIIYTFKRGDDGFFQLSMKPYVNLIYRNICDSQEIESKNISKQYQGMLNDGVLIPYLFREAVIKRIVNTERPVGFFLSGGLDSSLVLATAMEYLWSLPSPPTDPIDVFSIGTKGFSADLEASQTLVSWLKNRYGDNSIKHHIVDFNNWNYETLKELIYTIETPDVTTVRASMPMYLLSKYVRDNTQVKIIMSGEGSDELFGGYLYFRNAPTHVDFETESRRLLLDLYKFDVLRCDRSVSSCGLEVRVPFLDRDLSTYVLDTDTYLKMPQRVDRNKIEKFLLRRLFEGVLPSDILWRVKDGMSDGVGKGFQKWVQGYARKWFEEEGLSSAGAEKKLYRDIYNYYYHNDIIKYQWMPKWVDGSIDDPSGTLLM